MKYKILFSLFVTSLNLILLFTFSEMVNVFQNFHTFFLFVLHKQNCKSKNKNSHQSATYH